MHRRSVKEDLFENFEDTFTYLIFDGELIFDVIFTIWDDLEPHPGRLSFTNKIVLPVSGWGHNHVQMLNSQKLYFSTYHNHS